MIRALTLAAALLIAFPLAAKDWQAVPEQSSLGFSGINQGERFEGRFARFTPAIRFDPAALAEARFEVEIDPASASSDNEERDSTLLGSDFFDVESHPAARYVAETFVAHADGSFEAQGRLSLRGVEKPVALRFTWTESDGSAVLQGEATLDRLDFDVGGGDWADADMIAHEVSVSTRLTLRPRAP